MKFLDDYAGVGAWFIRLAFAAVFLFHGLQKALMAGPYDMMVGTMGMPAPVFYLVTFAEVAAGAGVLVGPFTSSLITRLAGLAGVPVMLGAIFIVHRPHGWSFMNEGPGGIEFPTVLFLMSLYFLLVGNRTIGDNPSEI